MAKNISSDIAFVESERVRKNVCNCDVVRILSEYVIIRDTSSFICRESFYRVVNICN